MDLQNEKQEQRFLRNLGAAQKRMFDLDPAEEKFVKQITKEYSEMGRMTLLSVKQFNWLKQIAEGW